MFGCEWSKEMRVDGTKSDSIAGIHQGDMGLEAASGSSCQSCSASSFSSSLRHFAETTAILEIVAGGVVGVGMVLGVIAASPW